MNAAEFDRQFSRLTDHFHLPTDRSRETIAVDWFAAVQHYHVDALERGVTDLIRTHEETFWPPLSKLLGAIRAKLAGYDKTRDECPTCNGATWIETAPWKSNGRIYTGFQRCPDCGVPAPNYKPEGQRHELTASEYQAWRDGTFQEPAMPLSKANHAALEALQHIDVKRGVTRKMAKAITGAPTPTKGAA